MAQTVVVVDLLDEVGNLAYDFFTYIPSSEELEGIAEENELLGAISCQYIGYNIGEGESDMDEFFSSKEKDYNQR